MRYKIFFSLAIGCLCCIITYSQCPDVSNINATNVCGLYGDNNGNSNWNWEINDINDPNYCPNWYAKTGPNIYLTRMGSPFVNATTGKLKVIADNGDYKKEKGWELLQRKFGCYSDVSNPYFILYNKYTGMMRVYVYMLGGSYSQLLMTIKSVYNHRPATISAANQIMQAPDKYFNQEVEPSNDEIMISLNEAVGTNQWAVAEYYMMLDDRIAEGVYGNGSLEITLYGVTNSSLEAVIEGSSCNPPNCAEPIMNGAFKTKNATVGGGSFNFTGLGEKLLTFSKSFSDFTTAVHNNAKKMANHLYPDTTNPPKNLLEKYGRVARVIELFTTDSANFSEVVTAVTKISSTIGQVLKFAGTIIGFFRGGEKSTAMPAYTIYNFTVKGSISAQVVVQSFVMKIPGTSTPPTNANNATYYNCPPGIFNLKNTPKFDTLAYDRRGLMPNGYGPKNVIKTIKYAAYRLHDNVEVMVNAGAGLSVLSVEGSLMAKVIDLPPSTPGILIGPLENYPLRNNRRYFNHMRADVEANRLEITHYDTENEKYHIIQTPFYSLECMNQASINAHVPVMKVYLRLRAVLKRTDNLGELIYFIKDYELDKQAGNINDIPADVSTDLNALPPYANYSIPPNTNSSFDFSGNVYPESQDIQPGLFGDIDYTVPYDDKRNHSITTSSNYYTTITCTQPIVIFRAGASVTLNPKFEAPAGSVFLATVDWGYTTLPCTFPGGVTNYAYTGDCYNDNINAQRTRNDLVTSPPQEQSTGYVYPNPASHILTINTGSDEKIKTVRIIDMSGKVYNLSYKLLKGNQLQVDVSGLINGAYSVVISAESNLRSYKFVVLK